MPITRILIANRGESAIRIARAAGELRREVARGWRRTDLVATFLDQVERG